MLAYQPLEPRVAAEWSPHRVDSEPGHCGVGRQSE
jgi:hypothetical protein